MILILMVVVRLGASTGFAIIAAWSDVRGSTRSDSFFLGMWIWIWPALFGYVTGGNGMTGAFGVWEFSRWGPNE